MDLLAIKANNARLDRILALTHEATAAVQAGDYETALLFMCERATAIEAALEALEA